RSNTLPTLPTVLVTPPRAASSTLFPYTTLFRSLASSQDRWRPPKSRSHSAAVMLKTYADWLSGTTDEDIEALKAAMGFGTRNKRDRKSTRLNSSHVKNSYAVFCLKKKKKTYYFY